MIYFVMPVAGFSFVSNQYILWIITAAQINSVVVKDYLVCYIAVTPIIMQYNWFDIFWVSDRGHGLSVRSHKVTGGT